MNVLLSRCYNYHGVNCGVVAIDSLPSLPVMLIEIPDPMANANVHL